MAVWRDAGDRCPLGEVTVGMDACQPHPRYTPSGSVEYLRIPDWDYGDCSTCVERD